MIGETDPWFIDVNSARNAGYPDLLAPPTFLFGLELDRPEPFGFLTAAGIDLSQILHGEQEFRYLSLVFAGDRLTFRSSVTSRYTKRDGELEFVVRETAVHRGTEKVAEMEPTIVALHSRDNG